ncbi:ERF family protein [Achromobacter sp. Marseille-Q0513]|uniref:ERF family protein n=1 Tax=Achromobacter sp. Marseille-Q0513 TaxID=2829161 RepID=UPI001B8FBB5D|nr:ERF family protein [Achromobacter sp. Marseille-Q0513]MBR8657641.1 ERF family protein [Achromobacter sp. Marseille-Q0513]
MSVHKKLMEARLRLQQAELKKSGHNKFAGYFYFELGDFLPTTQEIFHSLGLCGVVSFTADVASLTVVDTDGGGEILFTSPMGSASLKGCHEVQNIGAVETYQRRYLWGTAMEIVEHDALDSSEPVKEPGTANKSKPTDGAMESLTSKERQQVRKIADAIQQAYVSDDAWKAYEEWDTIEGSVEFKTAIWSLLDSKCRAAIKQMKEQAQSAPAEESA